MYFYQRGFNKDPTSVVVIHQNIRKSMISKEFHTILEGFADQLVTKLVEISDFGGFCWPMGQEFAQNQADLIRIQLLVSLHKCGLLLNSITFWFYMYFYQRGFNKDTTSVVVIHQNIILEGFADQ